MERGGGVLKLFKCKDSLSDTPYFEGVNKRRRTLECEVVGQAKRGCDVVEWGWDCEAVGRAEGWEFEDTGRARWG